MHVENDLFQRSHGILLLAAGIRLSHTGLLAWIVLPESLRQEVL